MQKGQLEFSELEWFADIGLFGDQVPGEALGPAEVPQLPTSQISNTASYKATKFNMIGNGHKKPRIEIPIEDEEYFTVPDLG
ncbi:unnamed protein product [Thlaspi arvense]|uniref:Uncharacterized protein n=1 Tax=Thlaspi arvense TaxID=13288 RepID=A0AAU9S838_THLAR|nr:unnamed protein product [Thlaspi arvense]